MAYTFARIGAVVSLTPQDYFQVGKRSLIRFREKGGKEKEIPVHHKLEEYLDVYLEAAKLSEQPASPHFRSTRGRSRELGTDGLSCKDAWAMLKRRLKQAGLPAHYSPHSFRATGITNFLENDGTLEAAQRIAGHADSRTTKPKVGSPSLLFVGFEANFHVSQCPSAEVCSDRTMHRKPMWLIPVS